METIDGDAVRDCTCFGCGVHLFRYNEVGRPVTNVPFAAVVMTRRKPSDVKTVKVGEKIIGEFVEFPSVCSRQCFEKAVAGCEAYDWQSSRDELVFEYCRELVRVMWGEWPAIDTGTTLPLMPERVT